MSFDGFVAKFCHFGRMGCVVTDTSMFEVMTDLFQCAHCPECVIIYAVYFYVRFGVSCRDLEEIMAWRVSGSCDTKPLDGQIRARGRPGSVEAEGQNSPPCALPLKAIWRRL